MFSDAPFPRTSQLLHLMLDGTAAGVALLDHRLRYTYVNPTLARMNGAPAHEHLGRTIAEMVPHVDAREDVLLQVLADGIPREVTSSGHTRAGSDRERRYWHAAYHRMEQDSRIIGVVAIVLEVTESREQQRSLERAQARFELLDRAATMIGTTLDMDTTCAELARFLVPELADVASVSIVQHERDTVTRPAPHGVLRLRRTALESVPQLQERVRIFSSVGEEVDYQPGSAIPRCLATGQPILENLPTDAALDLVDPTPGQVAAYRAVGIHSALVVPLSARSKPVGTVTLARAGNSAAFTSEDVVIAQDLAGRAAISLDNARRYTYEHHIALELQRALLSGPNRPHQGLDIASRYLPSGSSVLVGGDWFDSVRLSHGRTLLVIGDVMGHGVAAAVDMSRYSAMLRVVAEEQLPPHLILERMDLLMARVVANERPATCLLALIDPVRGLCTYSSAGHLPPALLHKNRRISLVPVPVGPPLGTGYGGYDSVTTPCRVGRTLLLYTDGLVERRGEDIDHSLGRLADLRLPSESSLENILEQLLSRLVGRDPEDTEDDVAVLAARVTPPRR